VCRGAWGIVREREKERGGWREGENPPRPRLRARSRALPCVPCAMRVAIASVCVCLPRYPRARLAHLSNTVPALLHLLRQHSCPMPPASRLPPPASVSVLRQIRSVFLLNCGGSIDLQQNFPMEDHCTCYVIDSHLPFAHPNIHGDCSVRSERCGGVSVSDVCLRRACVCACVRVRVDSHRGSSW
jgi:hypothetical protein